MSIASEPHATNREIRSERSFERQNEQVRQSAKVTATGFSAEAVAAAGAVVLTIVGLSGVNAGYMVPIATILIAAAMIMKSTSVAARFHQLEYQTGGDREAQAELGGGMSTEMAAGAAGIALGVLALVGVVPDVLTTIALIVFGGALLIGGGETYRVSEVGGLRGGRTEEMARRAGESAGGAESLVGIAGIVLGILALTGISPGILVLSGLLSVAAAQLFSGLAVSGRMFALLR